MAKKNKLSFSIPKIVLLFVVLGLIGGGCFLIFHESKSSSTSLVDHSGRAYPPSTPQDNAANNARKSNPATASQTLDNGPTKSAPATSISVLISRAGVYSINGVNTLEVGTIVNGATTGTCVLTVSQSGEQPITQTASIGQQNNTYACSVFDIPTSQFPNQGDWDVSVSITSNGSTAANDWGNVDLSN